MGDDVVGSDIWYEKVEFAVRECARLGLEFSFGSCAGWVAGGPSHHCAISVGHIASKLEKLARLLDLRCNQIC